MELALRLGQVSGVRALWATEKAASSKEQRGTDLVLGMGFGFGRDAVVYNEDEQEGKEADEELQPNLLSLLPVPEQPSSRQLGFSRASENRNLDASTPGFDVNKAPSAEQGLTASSSPNTTFSTFPMEFSAPQGSAEWGEAAIVERESSRISDEEENGRKKLRLSKEQSTFLEESFKEHNTLNPKQKLALAKRLNLRPRQVEVWFQNRRARTKLKQTEVDCEYLKRCCQTLSEENRRLQKEVAELRALKTSHPLYMHLPATTLSMCPSCERVASTTTTTTTTTATTASTAATPASTTVNGDHLPNSLAILLSKAAPSASPPFPAIPRQPSPVV